MRLPTLGTLWAGGSKAPPGGPWLVRVRNHCLCNSLGVLLLRGQVLLASRVGHDCLTPCLLLGGGLLLLRLEGGRMLLRRLEWLFEGKLFEHYLRLGRSSQLAAWQQAESCRGEVGN